MQTVPVLGPEHAALGGSPSGAVREEKNVHVASQGSKSTMVSNGVTDIVASLPSQPLDL